MNKKAKKRALRIRLAAIYGIMVVAVLLLVAGLYFIVQGYRFNQFDGKIEQGGLVQFNTTPTGADVWLDEFQLANRTQSKLTVGAGSHTITMQKNGYNPWKKTVTVRAGEILWLDYVRLIPNNLTAESVLPLTGISSAKASHDAKTLAVIENAAVPAVTFVNLDSTAPTKRQITLPVDTYIIATEPDTNTFELYAWSYDNRYILLKHTTGASTEWISLNTADGKIAKNITTVLGVDAKDVQYSVDDANTLFILTAANEFRKADIDQKTITGPLLQNVSEFSMYDPSTVVYATNEDPTTHKRTAGYYTLGAATPRAVYQTEPNDKESLHISINKYYGRFYQAVAHGSAVMIFTGDVPASDPKEPGTFTPVVTLDMNAESSYVDFSPGQHRFIYAGGGNRVITYDLDLKHGADISLQAAPQKRIEWVDGFHFVANEDATVRLYDYDGTNGHDMFTNVTGSDVALLPNNRYLNTVTKTAESVSVSRIKMIVD